MSELKAESDGTDIIIWGSIMLFQWLLLAGLVDEVRLRICPVPLGAGKSAFPASGSLVNLDLREAQPVAKGGVLLRYRLSN